MIFLKFANVAGFVEFHVSTIEVHIGVLAA